MGILSDALNNSPRAVIAVSALCFVAACVGQGSSQISVGPLLSIKEGQVLEVDGQYFYISDIAEDQSTITVMAYVEGFTQANVAKITLVKSSTDGLYYFSTASLSIIYDPKTGIGGLTWTVNGTPSVNTLINEITNSGNIIDQTDTLASIAINTMPDLDNDGIIDLLDTDDDGDGVADNYDSEPRNHNFASVGYGINIADASGVTFLPSVSRLENWSQSQPSTSDVGVLISNIDDFYDDQAAIIQFLGFTPQFDLNFSYDDFNVVGLEESHNAGWTGYGSNIYIIDGFDGSGGLFYDVSGTDVSLTHGANTFGISLLVAPEAYYNLVEFFSLITYTLPLDPGPDISSVSFVEGTELFSDFTGQVDTLADAANVSLGVHLTDGVNLTTSLVAAADFITSKLQPIANSLPNAVIVESAGNNGAVTWLSNDRGCVAWGGRNSASSCTDVFFALDDQYYDALDRTIFVGSYDDSDDDLAWYSVSAGLAADHFIVADGTSPFDDGFGTSYAAPRVTGAIGLISQKFPALSAQARKGLILDTATDLGATGVDGVFGHGLLNVTNALNPLGMLR